MRARVILGNWKMNLGAAQAGSLARDLRREFATRSGLPEIGVCPSPVHLSVVREQLEGSVVRVGAQDLVSQEPGAYTGGVAAEQLKELGIRFSLVGHSERRQFFGDADDIVGAKVRAALRVGLQPVVCFGERLEEREAGQTQDVVMRQLEAAVGDLSAGQVADLVLAYEPVWAIGTGRNAEVSDAREVHTAVRDWVGQRWGTATEEATRIVYGGSVKPSNVAEYLGTPGIDGALVGGASLAADSFLAIVEAARD